jgi:PAS domain S-box-containing protein
MLFSANEGIVENYNKLLTRTEILDQLLDQSHDGILLTDTVGKILIFNKKFIEIFDISGEVKGKNIREILESSNLKDFNESDFYDDLIFFKKKIINMEKRTIIYFNYEKRIYFSFQEVTYIKKLEQNLSQKLRLKGQIARYTFKDIIGISERMKIIIDKAKKIAKSDLTILITGESGTGKEIMAQAIHNASPRKNQPFIAINSAALSDDLIESELFGYDRGSFTGALKEGKKGLFERGNNGTIFLDEIGDMPHHLQSKLLRVLQERQITPIGSDRIIDVDIRVIAATHKDPMEMIETGSFRKDLFYRLNVFPIKLPALRDRPEDIPILLQSFTGNTYTFNRECMNYLVHYNWPGNIRELINITQYISTVSEGKTVGLSSLPYYLETQLQENASPESFDEYEKERFILEQKTDFEQALYVMKAIKSLNEINKTAGRKHIDEVLKIKGIQIQENHLRKIMETLHLIDFIIIKKGRGGSFMTEKGLDFFQKAG